MLNVICPRISETAHKPASFHLFLSFPLSLSLSPIPFCPCELSIKMRLSCAIAIVDCRAMYFLCLAAKAISPHRHTHVRGEQFSAGVVGNCRPLFSLFLCANCRQLFPAHLIASHNKSWPKFCAAFHKKLHNIYSICIMLCSVIAFSCELANRPKRRRNQIMQTAIKGNSMRERERESGSTKRAHLMKYSIRK